MSCKLQRTKLAIIGLGYVGLPLAVEFGKKFCVIGFDLNSTRVEELKHGIDKTNELNREEIRASSGLSFSSRPEDIADVDTYIVTVPTPIDKSNKPDLSYVIGATENIASYLKTGDLVIYESTVFPGVTEEICAPILEKISKLKLNQEFYCGYSPERINPGDKINTITRIKKITSGSTNEAADSVDYLYKTIIDAGTWKAPSIQVAEAAKVIENSQRDLNIAFVNELSIIFEKLNIDTTEVLEAAGSKWNFLPFRPGMVGGHCISVDPYYLTYKAEEAGYYPEVILSGRRINEGMATTAANNFLKRLSALGHRISSSRIGILGITFKENCPDIRNSKVFDLISEIKQWGGEVIVHDNWASPDDVRDVSNIILSDLSEFKDLDGLIIAVGHSENRSIGIETFNSFFKNPKTSLIGDLKALYSRSFFEEAGFKVYRL